jgi:4-amino-4-deoxy-L-arabinose transferase-like glycosyltransferase
VFSSKYRFQHISGIVLAFFGIAAITLAIVITPTFAATYLLADHNITHGGIKLLNDLRLIATFIGVLLIISGSVLMTRNYFETKLQQIRDFSNFGIFDGKLLKRREPIFIALFIVLLGIIAFVLMLWITPYGAGVGPDAITYLGLAKSILSGNGYYLDGSQYTHFPPLYPLFLAATNLLSKNFILAARILNALLFGINVGLIALAVYLTAGRNFLTSTLAGFFFLSSSLFWGLHAEAWSEPLFIAFSLACIIFLFLYVYKSKLSYIIAASLSLGLAILTRYIGAAFLPAILAIVFFCGGDRPLVRRLWDALICLILSCLPLAIFVVRNMIVAGSATDRSFANHPMPVLQYLKGLFNMVFQFFEPIPIPSGVATAIALLIGAILITLIVIFFKMHFRDINWHTISIVMPIACLLLFVSYSLFLFISISFFDASTPVNTRILSPILVILIVGVFSTIWAVSQTLKNPILWLLFLILIATSIFLKAPGAIKSAATIQENGQDFTSRKWQSSDTMAFINLVPDNETIYSNGKDVIGFYTKKQSLDLPKKKDPVTSKANSLYSEEIDSMCKAIKGKAAILVYFDQITWRWYFPTQKELESTCELPVSQNFDDGTVFGDIAK